VLVYSVEYGLQFRGVEQGGCAATKVNGVNRARAAEISLPEDELGDEGIDHIGAGGGIGGKMEVTVVAGLFAKGDMEVYAGHLMVISEANLVSFSDMGYS
jgi:hypothetical protein